MKRIYEKRGRKSNYIVPENEKLTFRGQYFSLPSNSEESPKAKFIREVAELCMVSPTTVRCWIAGMYKPDALKIKLIAENLGVEPEILFPNEI
ncbi:MAG: helix-turn-helix transcriptional regulator [Bacteroidales bacterium]|nr:helix-turn-helix transcriptional regulator [Bacteroidales bacterium]MDP3452889.1 helix-turn-helix transcriptional regulator [Bacteroidales bacterium]